MNANYTMLNDSELDKLMLLPKKEQQLYIEQLIQTHPSISIDNLWDGLHYLLTGLSASEPLVDDPLSEAVVGIEVLDEDNYAATIYYEQLAAINETLDEVNFDKLGQSFMPSELAQEDIYPAIWLDENKNSLFHELKEAYAALMKFYQLAQKERHNVIVTIY